MSIRGQDTNQLRPLRAGPVGTKLQYEDIWRWALPEPRPARRMQQDSLPVAS